MLARLVDDLIKNPIFRQGFRPELTSGKNSVNLKFLKVVCRNDTEVFSADGSQIRCSYIQESGSYSILDNPYSDSDVSHLSLSSLGKFLASLSGNGNNVITVFALPDFLSPQNGRVKVKPLKLEPLPAGINKIIWHTAMAQDTGLVVLTNDSKIYLYDLLKPTSKPQLAVDLTKSPSFSAETASSLSFGSEASLSGALTLYITTNSGKIFALYPFINNLANIATTQSSVKIVMNDTKDILQKVEKDLSTMNINEAVNKRPLWHSIFGQYTFYSSLWAQIADGNPLKIEKRRKSDLRLEELAILGVKLPHDFSPEVQGPLFSSQGLNNISDIAHLSNNENLSYLMTATIENNKVKLDYFVQFLPMIMKFGNSEQRFQLQPKKDTNAPKPTSNKSRGYAKPKRGFGFVDLDDAPSSQPEPSDAEITTNNFDLEHTYWSKNFVNITRVGSRAILEPVIGASLTTYNSGQCYILRLPRKLLICTNTEWPDFISRKIELDGKPLPIPSDNLTEISSREDIISCSYVNDKIDSNWGAVVSLSKSSSENLKVVGIEKQPMVLRESTPMNQAPQEEPKRSVSYKFPILQQEPFSQLESEIQVLKSHIANISGLSVPKNVLKNADGSTLKSLSEASLKVIEKTIRITAHAVNLKLRIETDIANLKNQIKLLTETKEQQDALSKALEASSTLVKLEDRHEKLTERIQALEKKIDEAIRQLSYKESMPLSKEEKLWIREVNGINALLINTGEDSLALKIEDLKVQVTALSQNEHSANEHLTDAEIQKRQNSIILAKLSLWLQNDLEKLDEVKQSVTDCIRRLRI